MKIDDILKELKGYHVEISLHPSGGLIDAVGCEECGTDDSTSACASWKTKKGESIETAIYKLKQKLGIEDE